MLFCFIFHSLSFTLLNFYFHLLPQVMTHHAQSTRFDLTSFAFFSLLSSIPGYRIARCFDAISYFHLLSFYHYAQLSVYLLCNLFVSIPIWHGTVVRVDMYRRLRYMVIWWRHGREWLKVATRHSDAPLSWAIVGVVSRYTYKIIFPAMTFRTRFYTTQTNTTFNILISHSCQSSQWPLLLLQAHPKASEYS